MDQFGVQQRKMHEPAGLTRTRSTEMVEDSHPILDEDPLLISQSLTYVTDDGSVLHSFQSMPFSLAFKLRFLILEVIFVLLVVFAVPIGAHGTVVAVSVVNLLAVAWFWYNYVRSVEITSEGNLRFWIGNIEIDVPFDKIVSLRKLHSDASPCSITAPVLPYRGFLSNPNDGVAIVTTVPTTPFWLWPRSAGKPERSFCCGAIMCPKLSIVFSPSCGGHAFIQDVEAEMRNFTSGGKRSKRNSANGGAVTPHGNPDFLDV